MAAMWNGTVGQLPLNRIATHLHGGFTPWFSDGTPFQWFTPNGITGASFKNMPGLPTPPVGTANYYYTMDQSARFVWYHDHAIGITRTNATPASPRPCSSRMISKAVYSARSCPARQLIRWGFPWSSRIRVSCPPTFCRIDPQWQWGMESDLWYPHVYEPNYTPPPPGTFSQTGRWDYGPTLQPPDTPQPVSTLAGSLPPVSLVPEFFADTSMVNGALYPVLSGDGQDLAVPDPERLPGPLLAPEPVRGRPGQSRRAENHRE